ncbi:MAG: Rnf-Nqr domain containing protein, partial [Ruthenibacterium sp.]
MKEKIKIVTNGLLKENPSLRLVLGTCPTLAVTTLAMNGLGMGLAATFVLIGSNIAISAMRKVIPDKVRLPAYITIIAAFVTILQMVVKAYLPSL